MKLVDLIVELEKNKSIIQDKPSGGFLVDSISLKNFEKRLFECEEFKSVVRINFIDLPVYLTDEETGEPILSDRVPLYEGTTKTSTVSSHRIYPNQELKFNKIVDLYSITLNKKFDLKADISAPGIWIYPTSYDEQTFEATNQIRIIWNPASINEAIKLSGKIDNPKDRLVKMFEEALEKAESNLPCEYVMLIRCSERSILTETPSEFKEEIIQ